MNKEENPRLNLGDLPRLRVLKKSGFRLYQLNNPDYRFNDPEQFVQPLSPEEIRKMLVEDTIEQLFDRRVSDLEQARTPDQLASLATQMENDIGTANLALGLQSNELFTEVAETEAVDTARNPLLTDQYTAEAKMLLDKKVMASERGFIAWKVRQRYESVVRTLSLRADLSDRLSIYEGTPKQKITCLLQDSLTSNELKNDVVNLLTEPFPEMNNAAVSLTLKATMDRQWLTFKTQERTLVSDLEQVIEQPGVIGTEDSTPSGSIKLLRARLQIQKAIKSCRRPALPRERVFLGTLQESEFTGDLQLLAKYSRLFAI